MNEPDELRRGLAATLGIEYLELGPERARARMAVSERSVQPFGSVHGGALAALAESVCSRATYEQVAGDGMVALGQANNAAFLRPITSGHVNADARSRHRGSTTWVWDCELSDDEGTVCALVRMTIAVRPAR